MLKNFPQKVRAWNPVGNPKLLLAMLISAIFCVLFLQEINHCFQPSKKVLALAEPNRNAKPKEALNLGAPLFTTPWFGQYIPVNIKDVAIKKSKLDAKLVGIVLAADPAHSQVIIKEDDVEKIYAVGDTLSGGAIVKRILSNKVIILHEGALESLSLPSEKLEIDSAPSDALEQPS